MPNEPGGGSREDEPERSERPDEADVRFGEQNEQSGKKNRFKENSQNNVTVCRSLDYESPDLGARNSFKLANLFQTLAEKDDADRFKEQRHNENRDQLYHSRITHHASRYR